MAEDRVWSAETERVRATDPLGPVWRAVVVGGTAGRASAGARELAKLLDSLGVEVVMTGESRWPPVGAADLVCAVDPHKTLAAERLAFDLDAPVLRFGAIPERQELVRAIEQLRVRREWALQYRTSKIRGFALERIEIDARAGVDVEFGEAVPGWHVDRVVVEPTRRRRFDRMQAPVCLTAVLADEVVAVVHEDGESLMRTSGESSLAAKVDGACMVDDADTVIVGAHARSRLVCC